MRSFIAILCLVSAVAAGSGWPAVIQSYDESDQAPLPSAFNPQSTQPFPTNPNNGEATPWDRPGSDSEEDEVRPAVVIRGIQEQLMEDLLHMERDLLFIRRLMGQRPLLPFPRQPPMTSRFPWGPPVLPPARRDPWEHHDTDPWGTTDEDDEEHILPSLPSGGSPWLHFPGLGFDRPIFSNIPQIPQIPKVDDLPDNYDNATHQIHQVNGSRVEVNTTTNKKTEEGFNSFFHHQVIHILPGTDQEGQEPVSTINPTTAEDEEVYDEEENYPEEEEEFPEDEEEENRGVSRLPEVENEVFTGDDTIPEVPLLGKVPAQIRVKEAPRRSRGVNVQSAPYVVNRINQDEDDYDLDDEDEDTPPKPDLSGDTRVNHANSDRQGISMVNPDAEIFDLGLVIKEAELNPKED